MGSGAFCLTHNYPEIEKDFIVSEHLDTWNTIDELTDKIKFYLKNDELRNTIRLKGCKHVHENHTWKNRMIQFKKTANL